MAETMHGNTDRQNGFQMLKVLLDALDPSKQAGSGKKGTEVFDFLIKSMRLHKDYFHRKKPLNVGVTIADVISRFLGLLRECVLTHQWDQALRVVEVLAREVQAPDATIWKVGFASLKQICGSTSPLLEQFVKQAVVLQSISVMEVFVELLLHHLLNGDMAKAVELEHELKKKTNSNLSMADPKRQMALTLFTSYQGLILYANWKMAVHSDDFESIKDDLSVPCKDVPKLADKAIEYLSPLQNKPGVWDIFITRVVEMHMHYGRAEEAKSLLTNYAQHNPENPNAYRYLYELAVSTQASVETKQAHLESLIELDPCNPLAVDLYHLTEPPRVQILFDYLDFAHCSNDLKVFNLLYDRLKEMETKPRFRKEVHKCWEMRKDWWPQTVLYCVSKDGFPSQRDAEDPTENLSIELVKARIYNILRDIQPS